MACILKPTMPTSCSPELYGMDISLESVAGMLTDEALSSGLPHDDQYVSSLGALAASAQMLTATY